MEKMNYIAKTENLKYFLACCNSLIIYTYIMSLDTRNFGDSGS